MSAERARSQGHRRRRPGGPSRDLGPGIPHPPGRVERRADGFAEEKCRPSSELRLVGRRGKLAGEGDGRPRQEIEKREALAPLERFGVVVVRGEVDGEPTQLRGELGVEVMPLGEAPAARRGERARSVEVLACYRRAAPDELEACDLVETAAYSPSPAPGSPSSNRATVSRPV
jgi:hypothetical protein